MRGAARCDTKERRLARAGVLYKQRRTMTTASFSQLHDATLLGVRLAWLDGDVRIELRTVLPGARHPSRVLLHAHGASFVRCPRRAPWGPSASVNDVRTSSCQDGSTLLEVEMQSGDVIEVAARRVAIEVEERRGGE